MTSWKPGSFLESGIMLVAMSLLGVVFSVITGTRGPASDGASVGQLIGAVICIGLHFALHKPEEKP